jgi:hypothetical protein
MWLRDNVREGVNKSNHPIQNLLLLVMEPWHDNIIQINNLIHAAVSFYSANIFAQACMTGFIFKEFLLWIMYVQVSDSVMDLCDEW